MAHIQRVGSALARRTYTRETLLIYAAPEVPTTLQPPPVVVRRATHPLVQDLAGFHHPYELQVFHEFLKAGHLGYLAYIDGRCVHRSWYVPGPAKIREHWSREREIRANEGFVHYCKTAEEARGMGVFPVVLAQIAKDHLTTRTTMAIAEENVASRRAATKAGWTPIEEVRISVSLGLRRQRRRPIASAS